MNEKQILLRLDTETLAILVEDTKRKRNLGVANTLSEMFLIRLLSALGDDTKTLLFKKDKNKVTVRTFPTFVYDDHRQTGNANREINGTPT